MKKILFRPIVLSRHPSHDIIRHKGELALPRFNFRSIIRFGSSTPTSEYENREIKTKKGIVKRPISVEINTVDSIKNSSNKLLMKKCFDKFNVTTAVWYVFDGNNFKTNVISIPQNDIQFPLVAKHIYGSRGRGNTLLNNMDDLEKWKKQHNNYSSYIFEKFYNYNKEYRLHVTKNGCFYTCRKMIKADTPDDKKWFKNDSNSVWILEENPNFDKPQNWKTIENECVKALKAVGLDIGAVDLRVQNNTNSKGEIRNNPEFIVIEINSAPSFGDITAKKYNSELTKILKTYEQ